MSISTLSNTVYLDNLSFNSNEDDIYQKMIPFGPIKRIKIFYQIYQEAKYSIGCGFVQFLDDSSKKKCIENGKFIRIKRNEVRVSSTKPIKKLDTSVFIFYSDPNITREKIRTYFINYNISDIIIRTNPTINHLGFSIIQFQTKSSLNYIIPKSTNSMFQIIFPSRELIELSPTKSSNCRSHITFTPNLQIKDFDKFQDFKILHLTKTVEVNSYLACIHSSRIRQLFLSNSVVNQIETRVTVDGDLTKICDFLSGKTIKVHPKEAQFIFLIAADLGIEALLKDTYGLVYSQMDSSSAIDLCQKLGKIELSIEFSPHVRFMAENVSSILILDYFKSCPLELISSVLHYLSVHSRDINMSSDEAARFSEWLFGFISQDKKDRARLLQFVVMSSMPNVQLVNIIKDESFNTNLLRRPLLRLLLKSNSLQSSKLSPEDAALLSDDNDDDDGLLNVDKAILCEFSADKEEDDDKLASGVFSWMLKRYNENPADIGIVEISGNSDIHKIIEFHNSGDFWSTADMPDSWIMVDFKEYEIIPSSYTLKAPTIRSWRLTGSKDGNEWVTLDERRNSESFVAYKNQYKIDERLRCRFVRLEQVGENNAGDFSLCIQNIEFFGELPRQQKKIESKLGSELEGVFFFLTREIGKNPCLANEIELSSSCDPKYLLGRNWNGCWKSAVEKFPSIQIDLLAYKLDLRHYALRSHSGPGFFSSWCVEVSNDNKTWAMVDTRMFRTEYKEPFQWNYWMCSNSYGNPVRFIRFRMIDKNNENKNEFWLSGIELFGELIIQK